MKSVELYQGRTPCSLKIREEETFYQCFRNPLPSTLRPPWTRNKEEMWVAGQKDWDSNEKHETIRLVGCLITQSEAHKVITRKNDKSNFITYSQKLGDTDFQLTIRKKRPSSTVIPSTVRDDTRRL